MTETKTTSKTALPENVEKKMVKTIDETFASESETFRAAAVIWGRKQLKYEKGLRGTKPPIPAALQDSANRAKTQARLEKIAAAIGADIQYSPAKKTTAAPAAPAETPSVADEAPQVEPDPKPASRKRGAKTEPVAA